ncbi:MAG: hypothetical protein HYX67_09190 [Candidatus Melainabacteria bacterium]|nr:hypothetical protein [Candidatus Melainabacteria bacterium]
MRKFLIFYYRLTLRFASHLLIYDETALSILNLMDESLHQMKARDSNVRGRHREVAREKQNTPIVIVMTAPD